MTIPRTVDTIVLGAGLAGCAMAWQMNRRGRSVALIERSIHSSCSRAAAGLVTPITGARFAVSWRWKEYFSRADDFYQEIEQQTSTRFWKTADAYRVFQNPAEQKLFSDRWLQSPTFDSGGTSHGEVQVSSIELRSDSGVAAPHGALRMGPAARLDTVAYLDATFNYFNERGEAYLADIDCDKEIELQPDFISIPRLGIQGENIVLCQGFAARENQFFHGLPLHPARGDILHVRSPSLNFDSVLHHTAWAVPLGRSEFLIGATYDRHHFDIDPNSEVSKQWRKDLMQRWEAIAGGSFEQGDHEVIAHRIGVRPASYDRHPLIGSHPDLRRVYCLNGLGSKGSLMAPYLAEQLADHILTGRHVDGAINLSRRFPSATDSQR